MSIIRDGIILLIYVFLITLIYMFTSTPFHEITSTFLGLGLQAAHTDSVWNAADTVYAICFVFLAGIPIVWFIVRVFSREPDWGFVS